MASRGHLAQHATTEQQRLQVPSTSHSLSPSRRSSMMSGSVQLSVPSRRESVSTNLLHHHLLQQQQQQQNPHHQHHQQHQHHHQHADQRRLSVASWMLLPHSRVSFSGLPLPPGDWHQQQRPEENSYRLEPGAGSAFSASRVRSAVEQVLSAHLRHESYQRARGADAVRALSDAIKERVKEMGFSRHKLVCCVAVAEAAGQGLSVASRGLWAEATDGAASATFASSDLVAVGSVYGLYYE